MTADPYQGDPGKHWEAMDPKTRYDIKVIVQSMGADPDDPRQLWHVLEALAVAVRLGQLSLVKR